MSLALILSAAAIFGVPLISLITKAGVTVQHTAEGYTRHWSLAGCLKIVGESPGRFRWEILWSVLMAAVAATMVLVAALPIAWLARRRDALGLVGRIAAISLAAAALAMPGPLLGIGLISIFNHPNAGFLNALYDYTIVVPAIAQAIRAFPLGMLIVWHALNTMPGDLLEAAELDGAGVWRDWCGSCCRCAGRLWHLRGWPRSSWRSVNCRRRSWWFQLGWPRSACESRNCCTSTIKTNWLDCA